MPMSKQELEEFIRRKDSELVDPEERIISGTLSTVLKEILWHEQHRYWQFTPCPPTQPRFHDRLCAWVSNTLSDEQIITMLRLIPHIQFVDRDDLLALYRAAFEGPITRWILDQASITFTEQLEVFDARLADELSKTWFCPMTDSMDIAQFHHINRLQGHSHRPSWRTLRKFGNIASIQNYIKQEQIRRIVLLEDFVGSGSQCGPAIDFAVTHFAPTTPVLFVPLIIADAGERNLSLRFAQHSPQLRILPAFCVPAHASVGKTKAAGEPMLFDLVRKLAADTFPEVATHYSHDSEAPQDPLGFGGIGATIVLHSNCPNNTLPFVWHDGPQWSALFPRISRS